MVIKPIDNPVITKELRSRMRGSRAYWVLFIYLVVLSITLFLFYLGWATRHNGSANGYDPQTFVAGRQCFALLFTTQAILLSLIMPALSSGGISIEREQRTFELLQCTTLPARSVVFGKLFSSLSFVGLLLTASLPLVSLCFLFGGVSPQQVFSTYLLLLVDAFVYGAVALAWSASTNGTATATALSYGSLLVYFVLTVPFALVAMTPGAYSGSVYSASLGAVNPIGATAGINSESYYSWTLPSWVPALAINGLLGALAVSLTIARLSDHPRRSHALVRRVLLAFIAVTLLFLDGISSFHTQASSTYSGILCFGIAAILLFVPPFVTDAGSEDEPAALPAVKSGSGLTMALSTTALVCVVNLLATLLWQSVFHSGAISPLIGDVLTASVAFGVVGFGRVLAAALKNRWAAMVALYCLAIGFATVPYYVALDSWQPHTAVPGDNWLYFSPLAAIVQICGGQVPQYTQSNLAFNGSAPDWMVTSVLYLAIGGISLLASRRISKRQSAEAS